MKKVLPFHVLSKTKLFTKASRKDYNVLAKGIRALVKRFGYQRVLGEFVRLACDEGLLAFKTQDPNGHLYREAFTLLDHAEKTLHTIVRLETQLAEHLAKESSPTKGAHR